MRALWTPDVWYVENVFLNLKMRKRIALHQLHKIILFLASSYDLFKQRKCFRHWT